MRLLTQTTAAVVTITLPAVARASTTGMPWESPLSMLKDSLTGPVAFVIATLGFLVAGATLIFFNKNDQLGVFTQRLVLIVLIVSGFFLGTSILTILFGFSASVM